MSSDPPEGQELPLELARPAPWWAYLMFLVPFLPIPLPIFREDLIAWLEPTQVMGKTPIMITFSLASTIALFVYFFLLRVARRRFGRCRLHRHKAVFSPALLYRRGGVTVELSLLVERQETPWGLLVRERCETWWKKLNTPYRLIPTSSDAELATVVRVLDEAQA